MSLTDLAALFKAAGDSDAVRDGIQAFVEEMLIGPEKLGEEEAVAKRAFAKLLNASGDVDIARRSVDAVHAEQENMNESTGDEDARKLEVQVQEAQDGLTTATARMEREKAKLLEFIFLRVKGRAIGAFEQNVESLEQYDELFAEWEEGVELSKIELDVALDHKGTQPFAILGQSSSIAKGLQLPMGVLLRKTVEYGIVGLRHVNEFQQNLSSTTMEQRSLLQGMACSIDLMRLPEF